MAGLEARRLGLCGHDSQLLDIGCGIGSVLLMNAWQLPDTKCIGIEAQLDRFTQAVRSISYNVGRYRTDQNRVCAINQDIRKPCDIFSRDFPNGFDIITGTPPYFGTKQVLYLELPFLLYPSAEGFLNRVHCLVVTSLQDVSLSYVVVLRFTVKVRTVYCYIFDIVDLMFYI